LAVIALVAASCGGDGEGGGAVTTVAGGATGTTVAGGPGTTVAAVAGEAPACEPGQTDGDLNLYNWSEYIDPELLPAFEEEAGVTVSETFYDSNETMLAQIQTGAVYDLIVPSDYMVEIMITDGMLLPLQHDAIPNISNLGESATAVDNFRSPPYDPELAYSVAYQWGTTGLGVDTEVVGTDFPTSWGLVFDPAVTEPYAGQISLLNDARETLGAALKYLGYSLNTQSQEELDAAAALVSDNLDRITKFDSDLYTDDLVNGEVAVSHGYSGNFFTAFAATDNPDRYAYVIPEEGATLWVDNMAIPATAEHPCTAHAFINFLLDAERGAQLTNWNYYASPNAAAAEFILPEILEDPAIYPPSEIRDRLEAIENTGDFEINYTDAFAVARS
jgi:spermidine/putrescine-binding protein